MQLFVEILTVICGIWHFSKWGGTSDLKNGRLVLNLNSITLVFLNDGFPTKVNGPNEKKSFFI